MTLDELIAIQRESESADYKRKSFRAAEEQLRMLRSGECCLGIHKVLKEISSSYSPDSKLAGAELEAVLNEHLHDLMMIAEMRLRAKSRAQGVRSRTLAKQVQGFLGQHSDAPEQQLTQA